MIIPGTPQLAKTLDEAVRGLVGFNAAGIAAVIAMSGKGAMTGSLRFTGFVFLIGIFSGVAAWIFAVPGPPEMMELGRDYDSELKRITIALYISAGAFLLGVTVGFFSV